MALVATSSSQITPGDRCPMIIEALFAAARVGVRQLQRVRAACWCLFVSLSVGCAGMNPDPDTSPRTAWLEDTGFVERAAWTSVMVHMPRPELQRFVSLTSVLRTIPGLIVRDPLGVGWGVHRELPSGDRCAVAVVLNGATVSRRTHGGEWTINVLSPVRDLDGVEVHVGREGPVHDETGCGTLLLWSRKAARGGEEPFRGKIAGGFWGDAGEVGRVTEVVLEPGGQLGQLGELDEKGNFVFAGVLPGVYHVVVKTAAGPVARERVRVYAYAETGLDILLRRPGRRTVGTW